MASAEAIQLNEQLRALRAGVIGEMTLEQRRAGGDIMGTFATQAPDTTVREVDAGGCRALWQEGPGADTSRVILYVHGGGGVVGSARTHQGLVSHLVVAAGCPALSVDFRLAPEHPFPAALDDVLGAYRWLQGEGYAPEQIAFGGDSLGGGLVLGALIRLRDAGEALPAAAMALSPWADLAMTAESIKTRADRDLLSDDATFTYLRDAYLGGTAADDPIASPLYADLSGLPPLYIQASDDEILVDDAKRLADRARQAGVDVSIDIYSDIPHVFQLWAGNLPEADQGIAKLGAWVRPHLGIAARATA